MRFSSRKFFALLSAVFVSQSFAFAVSAAPKKHEDLDFKALIPQLDKLPPPKGKTKLLQGSVGQAVVQSTNVFGYAREGAEFPKLVTYVAPNSQAWKKGLQEGDRIIAEKRDGDLAAVMIQRNKKWYYCVFKVPPEKKDKPNALQLSAAATASQNLSNHEMVMLLDSSASMRTLDCPGGISRWQWCREHIKEFYLQMASGSNKNFSLIKFDSSSHMYHHCSLDDLTRLLQECSPTGETNMASALEDAFSEAHRALDAGKPALIAVITDGRPTDADRVKQVIIQETARLRKSDRLSVVFIEIGTPEQYLRDVDTNLVGQGAKSDIVSVIPFSAVSAHNLSVKLWEIVLFEQNARLAEEKKALSTKENKPTKPESSEPDKHREVSHAPPPVHAPPPMHAPPPIKAHPAGTYAVGMEPPKKVQEVNEKETVRRENANRTYDFQK